MPALICESGTFTIATFTIAMFASDRMSSPGGKGASPCSPSKPVTSPLTTPVPSAAAPPRTGSSGATGSDT
ncbi:MAG: hypothetical protein FJ087_07910 [Deltaproteobacteria bacterium]|nr:hypothetical protein [Deltaproteobacteria bacterium]